MSLVWFHRLLIGTAILFCAGYAVREALIYQRTAATGSLLLAIAFAAAAVGLAVYLRRLRRFLKLPEQRP
ncbi:MAG: hypothetical protein ACRELD_05970 [Longimicrobiales bacterium]